jgi:hypothetical protein
MYTSAPNGSSDIGNIVRAGYGSEKASAYEAFIAAMSESERMYTVVLKTS